MPEKFSAYMSIFNDWDILPQALRSVAPYIDDLVVVDGAYKWMAPFLLGTGKSLTKSAQPVYDCLEASGIPYRVINGIWEDENHKRKTGYLACRHRHIFRIDADEVYFMNEQNLEDYLLNNGAVGEMEIPYYLAPRWLLTHKHQTLERVGFVFDASQIDAENHLYYLWLIDGLPSTAIDRPPVFSPPLSLTAHLTSWRTPSTSVNRAAFYMLNHIRHHGTPWYKDLTSRPIDDLALFFERVPPGIFLDVLKNHEIVVGSEQLKNRVLKRSPLAESKELTFAPLFDTFLKGQAEANAEFAASGRYALGAIHLDVTSQPAALALSSGRELTLKSSLPLRHGKAFVRYLIPDEPWEVVRELTVEIDSNRMKIDLPFGNVGEPAFVRRFLRFEGWAANGNPLLNFTLDVKSFVRSGDDTPSGPHQAMPADEPERAETANSAPAEFVRDDAKIQYLRRVRKEHIDPITAHPYYATFLKFLEENETDPHYPRFALTMAETLNVLGDSFSQIKELSVCETGSLSLISRFLISQGCMVKGTQTDLRYSIECDNESVDILFSLEVLEHIKDQREATLDEVVLFNGSGARKYVEEMWRVLRPGGVVVLTTPNPSSLSALTYLIKYEPAMVYRPHVREYTKSEIIEFFPKFEMVRYRTFFAYNYLENGAEIAKDYAQRLEWNPENRGDCHFFIFRKSFPATAGGA